MPAITWGNSSGRNRTENDLPQFVGGYRLSVLALCNAGDRSADTLGSL